MAKKEVTKAPTGLNIVRSENSFTASWKIGDKDYADGQYFQYAIDTTGKISWLPTKNTAIGTKTTSRVIATISKSNYYPNTDSGGNNKPFLYNICFRVKGNRKKYTTRSGRKKKTHNPSSSAWTSKGFVVNPPKKPTLTYVLDEELTNVCTFSWNAPYESNDSYIFTDVQWQTILVKNSSETNGSKLDWSKAEEGTSGAEGSKTITEDTSILYKNGNSYTRWFRARSRGPRGVYTADGSNGWVYEKHVYALSHQADVTGTSASETEEGGFQCTVDWTAGQSGGQNPIDKTIAQYTITTPDRGLTCPSGASWKDANISRDTEAGDAAVFGIDDQLGKDQCLFIRVNTQHDSNITYGKPQLSYVGFLKDPSGLSVSTDNATHKATITATNNSAVEDSILIVRYVPSSGDPIDVGVIPHGSTSVTVQCPNWDDQKAIAFDVYAIVGTAVKQTRADGVDSYSVSVGMRSQNTVSQGGAVPVAPKNVSVSRVEGKSDTVRVDWDWPWSEAGSAEISWSDHDDAWESTDGPESFLISNLHASHWNISGLETGKTWYVRVRLIAGNMATSDGVTYGPWSDVSQGTIDLSSAPNKPVLILSNSVIPEDGSTIASWVYTTTDNTAQAYAEVAIVENGAYIPIAHSLTAQHVTIPAQSENYTLSTGNIYNLVCRVKSASGKLSEWSDIVSLTVAEPITCEIVQTSLVHDHIELNPREFGPDDLLTFETELEEDFAKLQVGLEPTQNLNGYSYPWVGGAGKNKLQITGANRTVNGITFTVNGDGSVTVNGTSTEGNAFVNLNYSAGVLNPPVDTPIVLAMKSDKPTSAIRIQVAGTGSPAIISQFSTSESFAVSPAFTIDSSRGDTATWVRLQINSSGTTIDNVTVYPMWSLASDAPTEWEPYENICPINGQNEASASVVGKNFLEVKKGISGTVEGVTATVNEDGSITINGTAPADKVLIGNLATGFFTAGTAQNDGKKHIPNGQYIITTGVATDAGVVLQLYGTNQSSGLSDIHSIAQVRVRGTFTIDDTYAYNYARILVAAGTYDNVTIRPMIRLASETDPTYEPYQGQTYTTALGRTVYRGTIDLASGVLTLTHSLATFTGTGNWGSEMTSDGRISYYQNLVTANKMTDRKTGALYGELTSNMLVGTQSAIVGQVYVSNGGYLNCRPGFGTTAADWKSFLASNNLQIMYPLKTPQTYKLTPQQAQTLVGQNNVWSDSGQVEVRIAESMRDVNTLTKMPLSIKVTGAGDGGITTVVVERAEDYLMVRPDETNFNGNKGEMVLQTSPPLVGINQVSFNTDDLIGPMDDGAVYNIVATVQDGLGQKDSVTLPFEVHWEHQAEEPSAEIVIDEENLIAYIKPIAPANADPEDVADIYRLSADKPELIVEGAIFGETYVDPYPALGDMGGHRIVTRTKNGDYITGGNQIAMIDSPELGVNPIENEDLLNVIDFEGRQIRFYWETDYSNTWAKDFQETTYLGGSIEGDWNPAVSRSGTLSSKAITVLDQEMLKDVRRLADYPGICHVRTADGSSYAADVQVSEDYTDDEKGMVTNYSLSITKVGSQGFDGMTKEQWDDENPPEVEGEI